MAVVKEKPTPPKPRNKLLSITSSREGFRRAGYLFGKEATTIALSDLSKEQVRQLNDEPLLTVTETEIEAE